MTARSKLSELLVLAVLAVFIIAGVWVYQKESDALREKRNAISARMAASAAGLQSLTEEERAWLRAHPVIRVVQDPAWPPIEFADEHGEPTGIANDYLKLVEQRVGVRFEIVRGLNWQEAYARLQRREIDMTTSVAVTPQRTEFWAFTEPYMKVPIAILARKDVLYIASMAELTGKDVAVVDGYAVNEWISRDFPGIKLVKVKGVKEGLSMLQKGSVFAFIDNLLVINYYKAKLKLTDCRVAGETPYVNAQCMAVRKDWAILAGILQKALESIPDWKRVEIYQKWVPLPIHSPRRFDYSFFGRMMALLAALMVGLAAWNHKLFREIAHRKAAKAALRETEVRYRMLFEHSPDGIVVIDPVTARFREFNEVAHRQLGYSREEFALLSITDLDVLETPEETKSRIAKVIREGRSDFETRQRTRQGTIRDVHVTAQMINILDRPVYYCVWRDITERKETEEKLNRALKEAERSRMVLSSMLADNNQIRAKLEEHIEELKHTQAMLIQSEKLASLGRLVSEVAHEVNNPLMVISGNAQLSLMAEAGNEEVKSNLSVIIDECQRAKGIVQRLLRFSRPSKGVLKQVEVNKTIEAVVSILEQQFKLINVSIERVYQEGLPCVFLDEQQMQEVFMNLLNNAKDAMPDGGCITIRTSLSGGSVRIDFQDTGVGMTEEVKKKIFEPFFTTKDKGTGLGLAVCYGIVKAHNGTLTFESEVNKGTTLTIFLPFLTDSPAS